MEPVRNRRNRIVVEAARLHRSRRRRARSETLIEGPHLLETALGSRTAVHTLFALPQDASTRRLAAEHGVRLVLVDEPALKLLAGTETPRGPVGVVGITSARPDPERSILVSCSVSDPGNLGTMVRTAAAFGWSFAYLPGSADPWAPKTMRAGAGGHFLTPITQVTGLSDLAGWTTVATVVRGGADLRSVTANRVAVLIGDEATGLSPDLIDSADLRVTIPMSGGMESLNAGAAAAVVVYELAKGGGRGQGRV